MCFIFASFGFHNSSYDLGSKGPAVKSVFVCLHKRRLLGYGRRFTCEARNHFVSPVYLQWEISSWQICSTVVSQVCSVRLMRRLLSLFKMELEWALLMSVASLLSRYRFRQFPRMQIFRELELRTWASFSLREKAGDIDIACGSRCKNQDKY